MKSSTVLLLFPLFLGIFFTAAGVAKTADSASFDSLRKAASHIPGWTEQTDKYLFFTAKDLYGIIDGGAADHEKQGLKSGISIALTGNGKSLEIFFENFGSASRAKGMVGVKKASLSAPQPIPQAKVAAAIYDEVIGGCLACWAKGNIYIEMSLTGYNSPEKALHDAESIIASISPVIR